MATRIVGKSRGGTKLTILEPFTIPMDEFSNEVSQQLDRVFNDNKTRLEIMNTFAKTIDPWVPFLEGTLSQSINVTPKYIEYIMPYATKQYFGTNFKHTTEHHPLASAQWDKVAMQTQLDSFTEEVKKILIRRANELYG